MIIKTKNESTATYDPHSGMAFATYPCGDVFALDVQTGGRLPRAWWRCPRCES